MFRKAGLDPNNPPKTWQQFLHVCRKLKSHGITPIGMGDKDGVASAWMFSILGKQNLDSITSFEKAIVGKADIKKSGVLKLYSKLAGLVNKGYFNENVSSVNLLNGWKLFPQKKVAMTWGTDSHVISWLKEMGADTVGIMKTPIFGHGKLAKAYDVTQSSTMFITSWSNHKRAAANFLVFLHSKKSLTDFFEMTGGFPADNRFNTDIIKSPLLKKMHKLDTTGNQVWLENFLPPMIDELAARDGGEKIFSRSGTPSDVINQWVSLLGVWRTQHPNALKSYKHAVGKIGLARQ